MKDKGVDFVLTCIDNTAALNLGQGDAQAGPQGDPVPAERLRRRSSSRRTRSSSQDDIVGVPFAPFETRPKPPGLVEFNKWMDKAGYEKNEIAMQRLDLGRHALRRASRGPGPNFTRQKVIDALNKMTDQTVDGLIPPRNWTKEHDITHNTVVHGVRQDREREVRARRSRSRASRSMCLPDQPATLPSQGNVPVAGTELPTLIASR